MLSARVQNSKSDHSPPVCLAWIGADLLPAAHAPAFESMCVRGGWRMEKADLDKSCVCGYKETGIVATSSYSIRDRLSTFFSACVCLLKLSQVVIVATDA